MKQTYKVTYTVELEGQEVDVLKKLAKENKSRSDYFITKIVKQELSKHNAATTASNTLIELLKGFSQEEILNAAAALEVAS